MIQPVSELNVGIDFGLGMQPVGRLAIRDRVIYFEYDGAFVSRGLQISPFRLPRKRG